MKQSDNRGDGSGVDNNSAEEGVGTQWGTLTVQENWGEQAAWDPERLEVTGMGKIPPLTANTCYR